MFFDEIDDDLFEELKEIMDSGVDYVECSNPNCTNHGTVEPDGDYPCDVCGEGRLTSRLITFGFI